MNSLPVRLFNACLSGLLAGTLLVLLFFHIQAIDKLAEAAGDKPMVLHVVAPNENFGAMRTALEAYIFDKPYKDRIEILTEKLTFP